MNEDNKFDGILMTMLQQKGNIDAFFDGVYGFLRRNTDFFANQKKAEEIIVNNCKVNFQKFTADQKLKQKEEQKKKQEAEKKRKQKEEKEKQEKQLANANKEKKIEPKVEEKKVESVSNSEGKKDEDDKEPAPKGNGGRTDHYIWTQTLENLQMFIFLNPNTTKKNLKVNFTMDKLQVTEGDNKLIDGNWKDKINTEQTYWTIEEGELDGYKGKYLHINVEKWKNQTSWWNTPIQGHAEINTQKINPEPSKLSDLDGETRSTVEKMMFDMRQKQQGLPSSDQLQKQQKLKQFMKMHPEMDFSQCKFN